MNIDIQQHCEPLLHDKKFSSNNNATEHNNQLLIMGPLSAKLRPKSFVAYCWWQSGWDWTSLGIHFKLFLHAQIVYEVRYVCVLS